MSKTRHNALYYYRSHSSDYQSEMSLQRRLVSVLILRWNNLSCCLDVVDRLFSVRSLSYLWGIL